VDELSIERVIKASPDKVWDAMIERFADWWCPQPWRTDVEKIEWKAGGASKMTLRGPAGEEHKLDGVILEYVPGSHWVSTDALTEGWVPHEAFMVGRWSVEPHPDGTLYRASARHWTADAMGQHKAMGFEGGWNACAAQLAALVEGEDK
jgi:uncharacterized protein YndB with AHSA1/START domain